MSTKLGKTLESVSPNTRRNVRPAEENNQVKQVTNMVRTNNNTIANNMGDTISGDDALSLLTKISRLEKDLERRKESYVAREEAYKERVASLEEELASQNRSGTVQQKKTDSKLQELKSIQSEILESVELVQDRTARIMQEQERDLLRSFRARLFDVQTELEKEKSKKDDGLAAWRERFTQLEAELDWATEVSNRLDKVNSTLIEENNELKLKFASQEQDRNLFIELLVSLKKDNALWRSKNTEIISENERLKVEMSDQIEQISGIASAPPMGGGKSFQAAAMAAAQSQQQLRADSEEKYKDINARLRRLVAEERKTLQQLRATYAMELKTRTEMEVLLRRCVDDVRQDIASMHHEAATFGQNNTGNDLAKLYNSAPGSVPFDDFDAEEHKRNLELLLSQERVVALIYAKTFPVTSKSSTGGRQGALSVNTTSASGMGRTAAGKGGNNGPSSPIDFATATEGSAVDMLGEDGPSTTASQQRPLTGNAVRNDKFFPPIPSATGNRLASR